MRRAVAACLALFLLSTAAFAAEPVDRLAQVAKLWGTVRYLHPWVAYKDVDWDAALVAAIPKVREAKSTEEYRAAVAGLLGALGDPLTRVMEPPAPAAPEPPAAEKEPVSRKLDGGVLVVSPTKFVQATSPREAFLAIDGLSKEIGESSAVVVDLRGGWQGIITYYVQEFLEELAPHLVSRPVLAPPKRYLIHSGYQPQAGGSSGGYYSGFVTQLATLFEPAPGRPASSRKVVFLLDDCCGVPPLAIALQAAGDARIVSEGPLTDEPVDIRVVDLGEELMAQVRVSEIVPIPGWKGIHADLELPKGTGDPLEAAAAELRKEWPAPDLTPIEPLPNPVFRPERAYADMAEPSLEYRQLAVIRAWNVIHFFYPYLHLIGDWDAVLPEFLKKMEDAKTSRDYALAMLEMMAHVADGHTGLWGRPEVEQWLGDATLPVQLRYTEGVPVVWRASDEARQAGFEVGDAILEVDGEAVAARIERMGRYTPSSTPAARLDRIAGRLLFGAAGSTAAVKVQKLDGTVREVRLVRDPKKVLPPPEKGDVVRILPGNLGYVDLTRLTVAEVDGMFDKLKDTRAIVFDMRGYPQGTAWSIAPRINTNGARIGAQFRRSQVSAFSFEESEAGFHFSQPIPDLPEGEVKYTRPTVMLIDDRAISQSEHSGLFYEAANGMKFIGTATAGANGDVTRFPVPGGIWIGFTGHDVRHADGRQLQRVGLTPDVEAAPTRAGLAAGRDEVLERAVAYLEEALK